MHFLSGRQAGQKPLSPAVFNQPKARKQYRTVWSGRRPKASLSTAAGPLCRRPPRPVCRENRGG
ncbi:hypothetical protein HMPREF3293_01356 [Christensenella minuta]|uniref:Uncharacterized protein n=1 Tax=Christensenella minuta TaxID=626937 RepID=A0A136Q5B1_9FIRM|nr:hypothetical protein HMPREF3293_01356 [Christensenella minuta]